MKKSLLGLVFGIVLCFGNAQEILALEIFSGMDIKEICAAPDEQPCMMFMKGAWQGYQLGLLVGSGGDTNFIKKTACVPSGVTLGQMKDIVQKFMQDNPEKLHLTAATAVVVSMKEAFPPCNDERRTQ